jgi:glucan phosphoethanolaminetransferase (alkaline phosphatase superfamily)
MRLFPVPHSITEEEKLFGGYLSLRQVVYLAFFLVTATIIIFSVDLLPLSLRLFLGFLLTGAGASLAFIKISNTGLDRYLMFAALYYAHQKKYYFIQEPRQ